MKICDVVSNVLFYKEQFKIMLDVINIMGKVKGRMENGRNDGCQREESIQERHRWMRSRHFVESCN